MAASSIPQVTSWTSLTRLADTACLLCSEGPGEKGEELLNSETLVNCSCTFMVHRSCWTAELQKSGQRLCPGCEKSMIPLHLIAAALAVKEINSKAVNHFRDLASPSRSEEVGEHSESRVSGLSGWALWTLVACILCFIIFVIGMVLGTRR